MGRKKRRLSRKEAKAFLATKKGQDWLEKKIAERNLARPDPGPAPERLTRTQLPFVASICGRRAWVSRNAYGIQVDFEEED